MPQNFSSSELSSADCLKAGTTLVFTLYDHDRLSGDDIAGEVYYDLSSVPGLTQETIQGGFARISQVQFPFIIPLLEGTCVTGDKIFVFVLFCFFFTFLIL